MIGLIFTTIFTSAADSLNPVAITQQFILQGMVKKPKHIWFFIMATGITNFIGGLMAYFGLVTVLSNLFNFIFQKLVPQIYIIELIAGIIALIIVLYFVLNEKIKKINKGEELKNKSFMEDEKAQISKKIKSVSPFSLFILGVVATITELTTALPYFAFLAVLLNYELSLLSVVVILFIYNFIYSSPLMILYYIYRMKQDLFEKFYLCIKEKMEKWSVVIMPFVFGLIGMFTIFHSISLLLW